MMGKTRIGFLGASAVGFLVVCVLVLQLLCGAGLAWSQQTNITKEGWISDESCAAEHTKPGRADCVEKCWRGGASVGHPEWKPQRAVFITDADRVIWIVENPDAVKSFPAAHVRVSGRVDAAKKMIHVEKIAGL